MSDEKQSYRRLLKKLAEQLEMDSNVALPIGQIGGLFDVIKLSRFRDDHRGSFIKVVKEKDGISRVELKRLLDFKTDFFKEIWVFSRCQHTATFRILGRSLLWSTRGLLKTCITKNIRNIDLNKKNYKKK